jgi:hypothetical protein
MKGHETTIKCKLIIGKGIKPPLKENWIYNKALSPTSKALKAHGKAIVEYHRKHIEHMKSN